MDIFIIDFTELIISILKVWCIVLYLVAGFFFMFFIWRHTVFNHKEQYKYLSTFQEESKNIYMIIEVVKNLILVGIGIQYYEYLLILFKAQT